MTASVVSRIIGAAVTALGAGTAPAGLTVNRYRTLPLKGAQTPLMSVYCLRDPQMDHVGLGTDPLVERELHFCVACYTTGAGGPIDVALDPLIVWAVQALFVDQHLGGLVEELQHSDTTWDVVGSTDEVYGRAIVEFTARYAVLAADPTATQ